MVMSPQKRLSLIVLAACLVFAAVFAEDFVIANLCHAHPGEPCSVCLQLETAHSLLEGLGRAGLLFLAFRPAPRVFAAKRRLCCVPATQTLVGLKIKNNS